MSLISWGEQLTSRLSDNLRSGHRAEDLAIVCLRQIGAVAQIPHPEDVGSDAIVTLLPRNEGDSRMLNASCSFWVQVKTSSINSLSFDQDQARWLRDLELPFFIARINSADVKIELFSPYLLWDIYATGQAHSFPSGPADSKMTLHLDPPDDQANWGYIGPPFVEWAINDVEGLSNRKKRDKIVSIFNDWCMLWQQARLLWPIGFSSIPVYESGEPPNGLRIVKRFSSDRRELSHIALDSLPRLEALLMGLQANGDMESGRVFVEALRRICDADTPELNSQLDAMSAQLSRFSDMEIE